MNTILSLIMGRNNNHPIVWELSCIIGGNQLPPFIASLTPAEAGRAITHQTPDSRLVPQIDLSVKLYNHGEGPY